MIYLEVEGKGLRIQDCWLVFANILIMSDEETRDIYLSTIGPVFFYWFYATINRISSEMLCANNLEISLTIITSIFYLLMFVTFVPDSSIT